MNLEKYKEQVMEQLVKKYKVNPADYQEDVEAITQDEADRMIPEESAYLIMLI